MLEQGFVEVQVATFRTNHTENRNSLLKWVVKRSSRPQEPINELDTTDISLKRISVKNAIFPPEIVNFRDTVVYSRVITIGNGCPIISAPGRGAARVLKPISWVLRENSVLA
ncbi:hypothetical protein RRG08_009544 [Elysia crispata]|uniref:Uncharacterized protein n=1 Tax=Elysia crispata TaxID=231223 RepID=A0AAE1AZJ0_9GAST|nr:hypothetical protein RRG08_009544 [Elysia crispata]